MTAVAANYQYWQPSAPQYGSPGQTIMAEGLWTDPLGSGRSVFYTQEAVHDSAGYLPSWAFRMPWGVGDAPQHAWATWFLAPLDNRGPGDNPVTFFRSMQAPVIQNFAMRWQGMGIDGGNMLMTGLYTPAPLDAMSAAIYGPGV